MRQQEVVMSALNMGGHCPPQIATPDFWPADEAAYRRLLEALCPGEFQAIGHSAGGREIWALRHAPKANRATLAVVGGMHGHEAQGPASCFNLLSVLKTGRDLKGQEWPGLADVNWAIIFCLNPDARARMPNSFVGLSVEDVRNYDSGLMADGHRKNFRGDVDPAETLILGGLYNDAGVDLIQHGELSDAVSPEREAALAFMAKVRPAVCLELHAHCAPPVFYCPLTPVPHEVVVRQLQLTSAIIVSGREAGYEFSDNTGDVAGLSTALYHEVSGAVPLLLESPQGVLDAGPKWDHAKIVDVNLFVMQQLALLA
jgi:hypothetical protein